MLLSTTPVSPSVAWNNQSLRFKPESTFVFYPSYTKEVKKGFIEAYIIGHRVILTAEIVMVLVLCLLIIWNLFLSTFLGSS